MTINEIMQKASDFASLEIKQMYAVAAMVNEWQKETGGTMEELLEYLETHMPKKNGCRA